MPNDQFFDDDDIILSIDDDLIDEIVTDVTVKEERFREDSILRLNKDQISSELTNLIVDRYRNNVFLKAKVRSYANLFFQYPQVSQIKFRELRPVIYTDKIMYYNSDDEHIQNKEYELTHFQKSEKLANFITQFHAINRDMSKQSYIQSANKLYALYAPFVNREDNDVKTTYYNITNNVDAVRHCIIQDEFDCAAPKDETVRLLERVELNNIKLYDGDNVNIIGFYNNVSNNSNEPIIFNIREYLSNIETLQEDENVIVVFNEPVFDKQGKVLIKKIKAKIDTINGEHVKVVFDTVLLIKSKPVDFLKFSKKTLTNGFFIYRTSTPKQLMYAKNQLINTNIIFRLNHKDNLGIINIDDIKSFILPNTVGELILLYEDDFHLIYNLNDLAKHILLPNGIHTDNLSADVHQLLIYIFACNKNIIKPSKNIRRSTAYIPYKNSLPLTDFNKHESNLSIYEKQYPSFNTFADNALNRYRHLKSQKDKGAYYFLNLIKDNLKQKYKTHVANLSIYKRELVQIDKELEKLDISSNNDHSNSNCQHRYAKEYTKLNKLLDDNGKTIFFDKKFDETNYALKQGYTGNSLKELRMHVMNEIIALNKNKKMSKQELEFEIDAIVNNKRPVQINDIAVLHTSQGDVVYVRQIVENKEMWVKKFRTPFKVCTDNPLINFNDLVKLDTCVKQSFDDVCRTNKNARVLHKFKILMSLKTELSFVLALLDKYDNIIDIIDTDINYYKHVEEMQSESFLTKRDFEYIEHMDYEDFTGEDESDEPSYQMDFNELNNFVMVQSGGPQMQKKNDVSIENLESLNLLLSFIQIPITETESDFILSNINSKFPKQSLLTTLSKYETFLMTQVNETAYKNNEKYTKMFDAIVKQKMQKKEVELLKQYYYNIFRYIIGYIIIVIFIRYPNYVMKVILPNCVQLLSYAGYPISEKDGQRSLINYFSCLITNISVSEDIRFQMFFEKEASDIQKILKETIDEIISSNYELKTQLEISKSIINAHNKTIEIEHKNNHAELQGFKPHFQFGNVDKMAKKTKYLINYLKTIQDIVERSKIIKQTILNIPNLVNACCTETLEKDTDFFKFFSDYTEFKRATTQIQNVIETNIFVDENLHPPKKIVEIVDIFAKYNVSHAKYQGIEMKDDKKDESMKDDSNKLSKFIESNMILFGDDVLLQEMQQNIASKDWWIDIFYPKFSEDFNTFADVMLKLSDKTDKNSLDYIKRILINMADVEDISMVRQTAYNFVTSKFRQIMGKIVNKQKLTEEMTKDETIKDNPIYAIIASVTNNKNYDATLAQFKQLMKSLNNFELLFFESTDNEKVLQNVFLLSYIILSLMKTLLFMTLVTNNKIQNFNMVSVTNLTIDATVKDKDNLKLTSDIVNYLLNALTVFLKNNIADPSQLKLSVEKLRELRKEEEIAKYKVDDDERELQMQLKKMGHSNWVDIFSPEEDFEMSEEQKMALNPMNVVKDEFEAEKDEVYQYYKGENDDADDNEDDFVSYEAYDN
jgi:hypothetical protein